MPVQIERCRICSNTQLECVLDLGEQDLTGVFPEKLDQHVTRGPLRLVKCCGQDSCGLLQLEHTYDLQEMYGDNYGYRSGLNLAMVRHLSSKINRLIRQYPLATGSLIIDIGSNDSTTLQSYPDGQDLTLVGVDPTGRKFHQYYPAHIDLIPDFFSAQLVLDRFPGRQAAVVTSFSMFYDLEDPLAFMRDVHAVLEKDGIWLFEQSYMPAMLTMNAYDTVCHEHLEYYAMKQIVWMAERVGFSLLDVELNDVNGGSFSITARKTDTIAHGDSVRALLAREEADGLDTLEPYIRFAERVNASREELRSFLSDARGQGKTVCALGASTKGNVLLQYCAVTPDDIVAVGEVNEDKFGKFTPGTCLPIVSEEDVLAGNFDYYLVLPWHFESFFAASEKFKGRELVFPLPELRVRSL